MIRINLSSGKTAVGAIPGGAEIAVTSINGEVQKQALMRVGLILAFPAVLWGYQHLTLPGLVSERDEKRGQLAELQDFNAKAANAVNEIKKIKEDEAKIQSRIDFLDRLSKTRMRDVRVFDLIQQVIPEKVWLTRFESDGERIRLTGLAMTDFEVSSFMEALAKSIYFLDVKLVGSSEMNQEGLVVKQFEISCVVEKPAS